MRRCDRQSRVTKGGTHGVTRTTSVKVNRLSTHVSDFHGPAWRRFRFQIFLQQVVGGDEFGAASGADDRFRVSRNRRAQGVKNRLLLPAIDENLRHFGAGVIMPSGA